MTQAPEVSATDRRAAAVALDHVAPNDPLRASEAASLEAGKRRLRPVLRAAQFLIFAQGLFFLWWSTLQWRRFSLTYDFAVYFRCWHAVWASGLNPLDASVDHQILANNAVFIVWPLAVITRVYPHGVVLLWVQDLALVAAELVVVSWMFEVLARSPIAATKGRLATAIFGTGVLLLVLNPWIYWSMAFDFHSETVAVLFLVLAARDLVNRRWRRMVLWIVGIVLCGYVTATYVLVLALAAVIMGRGRRRAGLLMFLILALLVPVIFVDSTLNHALTGQLNNYYGYLTGRPAAFSGALPLLVALVLHIPRVLQTLWDRAINIWANLAPSGLFGLWSPLGLAAAVILVPENILSNNPTLVAPSFQYLPLYVLLPLCTVFVLCALARRSTQWGRSGQFMVPILMAVVIANSFGWAIVWFPQFNSTWLKVQPGAATVLARVERLIPPGDEVIASQGIAGRFADRDWIATAMGPGPIPVHGSHVWLVLAPRQGIETDSVAATLATIDMLAGPMRAQLVDSGAGIWAFRWDRPNLVSSISLPDVPNGSPLPGWVAPGPSGVSRTNGPVTTWRLTGSDRPGYVLAYDYWKEPVGTYRATVTLSASGPVEVEVWNTTGDILLARRDLPMERGTTIVSFPVDNAVS